MIQLPRRSVTRFFIPLIDVLTLLFCIFLLLPMVQATGPGDAEGGVDSFNPRMSAEDRKELTRLRREKKSWQDLQRLKKDLAEIRQEKREALQTRLEIRVLEIGEKGRLFDYDPGRAKERRIEITRDNVRAWIEAREQQAREKELYVLILYPRPASGFPGFPLQEQREEYDRWFQGVAHSYDIPRPKP